MEKKELNIDVLDEIAGGITWGIDRYDMGADTDPDPWLNWLKIYQNNFSTLARPDYTNMVRLPNFFI